jgi:hypothetical protein
MTVPVITGYVWYNSEIPDDPGQFSLDDPRPQFPAMYYKNIQVPWPDQWVVEHVHTVPVAE